MRISDWSSDVCSSDLRNAVRFSSEGKGPGGSTATGSTAGVCRLGPAISALATEESAAWAASSGLAASLFRIACLRRDQRAKRLSSPVLIPIGRAPCRGRGCKDLEIAVVGESIKNQSIRYL